MDLLKRLGGFLGGVGNQAQRTIGGIGGGANQAFQQAQRAFRPVAQQVQRNIPRPPVIPKIQVPVIPKIQLPPIPQFRPPAVPQFRPPALPQAPKIDFNAVNQALSNYYGRTALSKTPENLQNIGRVVSPVVRSFSGATGEGLNTLRSAPAAANVLTAAQIEILGKAIGNKSIENKANLARQKAFAEYTRQSQTGINPVGSAQQIAIDKGGLSGLGAFTKAFGTKGLKAGLEIAPVVTGLPAGASVLSALGKGGTLGAGGNVLYSGLSGSYRNKSAKDLALQAAADVAMGYGGELGGIGLNKVIGKAGSALLAQKGLTPQLPSMYGKAAIGQDVPASYLKPKAPQPGGAPLSQKGLTPQLPKIDVTSPEALSLKPKNVAISKLKSIAGDRELALQDYNAGRYSMTDLPVLVKIEKNGSLTVLDGNGRIIAAQQAGQTNIPITTNEKLYREILEAREKLPVSSLSKGNRPFNKLQTRHEELRNAGQINTKEYKAIEAKLKQGGIGLPAPQVGKTDLPSMYGKGSIGQDVPESFLQPKKPKVPVKASDVKNMGLIESVKESPLTKTSLRNALESQQYEVLPNKVTMDQAVKTINKNPQGALNEVLSTKPRTAQLNAQGLILAEKAQQRGDFETAQSIFKAMAPGNTKEGQAIQVLSVWSKTKPEGVVRYAQKVVDDANNTLIVAGKNPSITLPANKAAEFRAQADKIAKMPEGKDKLIATQKMLNDIHQQVPASIGEKAQSVLYYMQLLNPKTAVRNIVGNTGFALSETAKDIIGAPIDASLTGIRRMLGQDAQRSIFLPNPIKQIKAGLAGGLEAAKEAKVGVNLSGLEGQLQIGNKQPAFRGSVGRGLDKAMQFELSVPDRTFYTSRYQQTLDNLMKGSKVSKPTKEMLDIADYDAQYATFQDDSRAAQAFMKIKQGLNANKDFGVGSFVINYPKTPGNLLARGIDYSPIGFVKSTLEIAKPLFKQGPFDQKKFIDSFSRAIVGTSSLVGTGALLNKAGIITGAPSKDKDVNALDKATGLGAYRINVDALKRYVTSGFKPQKLQDGDKTLTYDWFQPAAIGLSMGANINETQASNKGAVGKLVTMLGTGGASVAAGAETLANQPLVQGLTKLTGQGGGLTQGALAIAQGVPASFVPTLLSQINQLTDNTSRSTYDPNPAIQGVNMVKAKIPGLAQTLQPQVGTMGQANERYQGGSNNPFNVFLNPAFVGTYNADNVQKEITRLENTTGQTSQYPAIIKNTQKVNGQNIQLTPQQVTDMQSLQGQMTQEAYTKIMSEPAYARLSDTDKVKRLQNIITQANQIARSQVLGDDNGRTAIDVSAEGKKPKAPKIKISKPKKVSKGRAAAKGRATSFKMPKIKKVTTRKAPASPKAPKVGKVKGFAKLRPTKSSRKTIKIKTG